MYTKQGVMHEQLPRRLMRGSIMSLKDKILKASTIKFTSILEESVFFTEKDIIQTEVPGLNIALSGSVNGGLIPGLSVIAGPSKHFKTGFGLVFVSAFLKKYPVWQSYLL